MVLFSVSEIYKKNIDDNKIVRILKKDENYIYLIDHQNNIIQIELNKIIINDNPNKKI